MADDPFACFNDDDDDSVTSDCPTLQQSSSQRPLRDPACGVLTFHGGTEQSLCHFVERELESQSITTSSRVTEQVLQSVDQFCYTRHWMMHVGDQKGTILQDFVQEFCEFYRPKSDPLFLLELGTYCGYSAILMAQTIRKTLPDAKFHIVSVDVDPNHQKVAQRLVELAQLPKHMISFVLLQEGVLLTDALRGHFQSTTPILRNLQQIHFVFIDHDKDLYVPDLQRLEISGWIQPGSHVAADNVVFFDIPYRSYIQQRKDQGILQSRLVQGQLEYVIAKEVEGTNQEQALQDGIELSVYLKDPSSK